LLKAERPKLKAGELNAFGFRLSPLCLFMIQRYEKTLRTIINNGYEAIDKTCIFTF
jgi:hypothetical protein